MCTSWQMHIQHGDYFQAEHKHKGGVMTNKYSKARKMLFHIQTKQTKVVSPLLGSNWQLSAAHTV